MGNRLFCPVGEEQRQGQQPAELDIVMGRAVTIERRDNGMNLWELMTRISEGLENVERQSIESLLSLLARIQARDDTLTKISLWDDQHDCSILLTGNTVHVFVAILDAIAHYNPPNLVEIDLASEENYMVYYNELHHVTKRLVHRLPSMKPGVCKISAIVDPRLFQALCRTIRRHGNITSLWIKCIIHNGDALGRVHHGLVPATFHRMEEVSFSLRFIGINRQDTKRISNGLVLAFGNALKGNESIGKVGLQAPTTKRKFHQFVTHALVSMPKLETFDMRGCINPHKPPPPRLVEGLSFVLLEALTKSPSLRQVHWLSCNDDNVRDNPHALKVQSICADKCEFRRISFQKLLTNDIPLGLWPLILKRIRRPSVVSMLLREKNDAIMVNLRRRRS